MNGNILDTNVIIRILKGDMEVANTVKKLSNINIPVIVIGELMFGAEKSQLKLSNREKYLQFCHSFPLLEVTQQVAQEYGKLKNELQSRGEILPENDMWIASIARVNNMTVYTQDKHFEKISGLQVIKI